MILHFACIDNSKTSGVSIAVLQHVAAQGQFADTALINTNGIEIPGVQTQLPFSKPFDVRALPKPFDRPDLAVFQECYRPAYLGIARHLRKNGIPYVIVPHGELGKEAQQKKHFKKLVANLLLFNLFANQSVAIQCLSEREFTETAFGSRKFIGTNGVMIPAVKKETFSRKGVKIVYIGRLDAYHKGLDLLIEAARLSKPILKENKCQIEIFGPDYAGRYENVERLIRENEVQDIISLNHEIVGDEKINKLLDSDIFMQTSRFEGMPLGILESLSYGLPCLVTRGTTLGEQVAESGSGWMAETNADSITEQLSKVLDEASTLPEKSDKSIEFVKQNYSWDVIAKKTVDLYCELSGYSK